jgi:hypothetical protein
VQCNWYIWGDDDWNLPRRSGGKKWLQIEAEFTDRRPVPGAGEERLTGYGGRTTS